MLFSKDGTRLFCYPEGKPGEEYTVPEGVTILDKETFFPAALKVLRLPESLNTVSAFGIFSDALEKIYIPAGVETIEKQGVVCTYRESPPTIYCAAPEKPAGWAEGWTVSDYTVVWGYSYAGE